GVSGGATAAAKLKGLASSRLLIDVYQPRRRSVRARARRLPAPPRLPESRPARRASRPPQVGDGSGTALRPDHAAHGQAVLSAHDQLRAARLGIGQVRGVSLPAPAPTDRPALAA